MVAVNYSVGGNTLSNSALKNSTYTHATGYCCDCEVGSTIIVVQVRKPTTSWHFIHLQTIFTCIDGFCYGTRRGRNLQPHKAKHEWWWIPPHIKISFEENHLPLQAVVVFPCKSLSLLQGTCILICPRLIIVLQTLICSPPLTKSETQCIHNYKR